MVCGPPDVTSHQLRADDGAVSACLDIAGVDRAPVGLVLTGHHEVGGADQAADCHHQRDQK